VSESSARKKNPQQHTSHDDDVYDPREAALRGPANAVERAAFWEWMLRQFWPLFVEEGHVHREGLDAALADADTQFAEMKKADEAWPAIAQARIREWEKLEDPEQRELRLQREARDAASRAASEARRQRRGTDEPW